VWGGRLFKMKMKNVESKVYNCPLSWWKSSAGRYMNLGKLVIKYLAVPATSAPSERIWSRAARFLTVKRNRMKEDVSAAMMYCRENKHILHQHYTEIVRRRGCMRATIILLRSTRLSCLHLKMKMMTTVNRKLMLEWIKKSGDYST
jgi:hypothetical protein